MDEDDEDYEGYERGEVGLCDCEVVGLDNEGEEVEAPPGSLWEVMGISYLSEDIEDRRYSVRLLTQSGRADARNIGYDGAWDGLLVPVEEGVGRWRCWEARVYWIGMPNLLLERRTFRTEAAAQRWVRRRCGLTPLAYHVVVVKLNSPGGR